MNSDERREARLRRRRECSRESRAAESSEQRETRLARLRHRRAAETSEQRDVRLARLRAFHVPVSVDDISLLTLESALTTTTCRLEVIM